MKILFLTNHKHLPELYGGMELNTHELCHLLIKRGHKVAVACRLEGGFTKVGLTNKVYNIFGYKFSKDYFNQYLCYRSFDMVDNVKVIIKDFEPDIVVLQGGHKHLEILKQIKSCPVVVYIHSIESINYKTDKNISYIANSNFTKETVNINFDIVIPPIIIPKKYKVSSSNEDIIFVNPSKHKGLEVVNGLAKLNPNLSFKYIVNSKKNDNSSYNNINNVEVIGPVNNMKSVYRSARLLIAPSVWDETWGRVASEAHCSGIPVLASKTGGLTESVGYGGICVPKNASINDWNKALHKIVNHENYEKFKKSSYEYSQRKEIDVKVLIDKFESHLLTRYHEK
ncbi:glycosyltransferase [Photobacterium sanctipauli]|nr:glycosyltransferase [Photobacterium sanctipauli]